MSMFDEDLESAVKMVLLEKRKTEKECAVFKKGFYMALSDTSRLGRKVCKLQNRIHLLKNKCNTFRTVIKSNEEDIGNLVGVIDQQNEQINQMRCCGNCDFGKGIMCSNDRRCMGDFENWVLRTKD